ncbi:histidine kinase [Oscillibacter valericigenes]|uniref:sensor histidine kinase n=1 Tax=Oscillibacter valericigenes TaxID=351091 RepID=UPI001F26729E|nr:histidine kinase [Oscillibacter valericigenes]MCF2665111.1 histidine kinase [Oscillibacter valericigenes]
MLRMEIALFLVLAFVAYVYFSAEKKHTQLHRTFSALLIVMLVHLVFDGITVYTVNHLETVPTLLNDTFHRLFIGTMIIVFFLFYQYIAILVEEETGKPRRLDLAAKIYLVIAELGDMLLPIHYAVTPQGNYSDGIHVVFCYLSVAFYFLLCAGLLLVSWKNIQQKKKMAIGIALLIELVVTALQGLRHTWLISGMGMTLITLAFYLILENPDILRAELVEQKMSMLYLKSQVNPHFLYNTLDTIRIQAQLNGDKKVADLLMRLVDFFRLSVKVDRPMVSLDDEMELLEAYMELMCYRYPELTCEYDMDPDLGGAQVPNFILQPIVENSLLHGLKNKGYRGEVRISAQKTADGHMEIMVCDTGSGFAEGKKAAIDEMLRDYAKQAPKLTGNSIGILNVQKRIKLLCGREFGLWYTENEAGGVTAHILLPLEEEVK